MDLIRTVELSNKRAKAALCHSPDYQTGFESTGISVQEKKFNTDFQDGGQLRFPIRIILATFWSGNLPRYFQRSFEPMCLFDKKKKFKNDFQHGCQGDHFRFPIRMILVIFDLQVTQILLIKFRVNWFFCSGEQVQNRFSRWRLWRPNCISVKKSFSYFWSTSHSDTFYQVSIGLSVQENKRKKMVFKDGSNVIHLGFPIGTILAKFGLQVIWCFLQNFEFIGLLVQKERKIRFQDSCHLGLWIRMILAIFFLSKSHPDPFYRVLSQLAFRFRRRTKNIFSRWRPWWPSLIFNRNNFSYFWSTSHPDAKSVGLSVRRRSEKKSFKMAAKATI